MRKIGFFMVLLIVACLVLLLPAHNLLSAPQTDFVASNSSALIAPSGPGEFLIAKQWDTGAVGLSRLVPLVRSADINHDGKLDLLMVGAQDGDVYRLLGNGDGTFRDPKVVC